MARRIFLKKQEVYFNFYLRVMESFKDNYRYPSMGGMQLVPKEETARP